MEETDHGHLNDVVANQESSAPIEALEESATENPYVESEAEPKQEENRDFSRKFAALSRKEKAIRAREAEYEQKLASLEERLQAAEKPAEPVEPEIPLERRLRANPLKALEEMGLSYDKLTELALNDGKLTSEMQMRLMREELENDYKSKFKDLENKMLEKEKLEEERKYDSVYNNFLQEIDSFVSDNKNEYEFINVNQANQVVYDVIEEHYNETGRILDLKDAADAVESFLGAEAEKLLNLNKVKNRLNSYNEPKQPQPPRQSQVTLSNAHSARAERAAKPLSDEDSKAQIAQMLRWED